MSSAYEYRDRLYARYASEFATDLSRGAPTYEANIVDRVVPDRSARILDAGCGQGQVLELLRERGYRNLSGVDVSGEQVALARGRGLAVERREVGPYLDGHAGEFDVILAVDLIEHFDKPDVLTLFDRFAAALAPGGQLIVRTPNAESPYGGRIRYGDFTHGTAFTQESIRQVAVACGFSRVTVHETPPAVHGTMSRLRRVAWTALAASRRAALAVETGSFSGHVVSQNLVAVAYRGTGEPDASAA